MPVTSLGDATHSQLPDPPSYGLPSPSSAGIPERRAGAARQELRGRCAGWDGSALRTLAVVPFSNGLHLWQREASLMTGENHTPLWV